MNRRTPSSPATEPDERSEVLAGLYTAFEREPVGETLAAIGNAIQHLQARALAAPTAPAQAEPVGEIVGFQKVGFFEVPTVYWAPGFALKKGTKLYATPPATAAGPSDAERLDLYIGGPYMDGSFSVSELSTGRILHKFTLPGNYSCANRAADPANPEATCEHWCGNGKTCLRTFSPAIRATKGGKL